MKHSVIHCEICQERLAIYGESFMRLVDGEIVEHFDPLEVVCAVAHYGQTVLEKEQATTSYHGLCGEMSPIFRQKALLCIQPDGHVGAHEDEEGNTWFSMSPGNVYSIRPNSVVCGRRHIGPYKEPEDEEKQW